MIELPPKQGDRITLQTLTLLKSEEVERSLIVQMKSTCIGPN